MLAEQAGDEPRADSPTEYAIALAKIKAKDSRVIGVVVTENDDLRYRRGSIDRLNRGVEFG
jgi:hypothetical protein